MFIPFRAEIRTDRDRGGLPGETGFSDFSVHIYLIDYNNFNRLPELVEKPQVFPSRRPGAVEDEQDAVGGPGLSLAPAHPFSFDRMRGPPHPGHVDEMKDGVPYDQPLPEKIPGRPGIRSDDRPVLTEERVEEGGFSDVRPPGDGQSDPFHERPAGFIAGDELFDVPDELVELSRRVGRAAIRRFSSGNSIAASIPASRRTIFSRIAPILFDRLPPSWSNEMRAWVRETARMRSLTASAWMMSSRPLR